MYKGGGGGVDATHHKIFLSFFFLEDKTSAPDVYSSCSFIPRVDFETDKFSDGQLPWLPDMTS